MYEYLLHLTNDKSAEQVIVLGDGEEGQKAADYYNRRSPEYKDWVIRVTRREVGEEEDYATEIL